MKSYLVEGRGGRKGTERGCHSLSTGCYCVFLNRSKDSDTQQPPPFSFHFFGRVYVHLSHCPPPSRRIWCVLERTISYMHLSLCTCLAKKNSVIERERERDCSYNIQQCVCVFLRVAKKANNMCSSE